jgi:hypothetical protein
MIKTDGASRLEPERVDLGRRQRDPRDRVDPTLRQTLPRPFNLRKRNVGLSKEVCEPVQALALGMSGTKPPAQRGEDDPVLGVDGVDWTRASGDMQKPQGRTFHGTQS